VAIDTIDLTSKYSFSKSRPGQVLKRLQIKTKNNCGEKKMKKFLRPKEINNQSCSISQLIGLDLLRRKSLARFLTSLAIFFFGVLFCASAGAVNHTVIVNADGTYTPQWLDIQDGDAVTWEFPDR
jgi:hypothetical protein